MTDLQPSDLTLGEAVEGLTVTELRLIERRYGAEFGDTLKAFTELTPGAIYCYERRRELASNAPRLTTWEDVEKLTGRDLKDYFSEEVADLDETDPDTPSGKGDSLDA